MTVREDLTLDGRGRPVLSAVSAGGVQLGTASFSHDDLGRVSGVVYGNGVTEARSYNLQGWETSRTASLGGSVLFGETLHYYSGVSSGTPLYSGRVAGRSGIQGGASFTDFYAYDGAGRLTGSTVSAPVSTETAISYDRSGNVLALKRYTGGALSEDLSWTCSGFRRGGFTYDASGNVTSDGAGGFSATYSRLGLVRTLSSAGAATTTFSYLADGTKVSALAPDGSGHVYLGGMRFVRGASGTLSFDGAPWTGGRVVAGSSSGACDLQYFTLDRLGSVRLVTDGDGQVVCSSGYMPYGTGVNTTGATMNGYTYCGKERQSHGGLLDFGARLYDPRTASWLSPDPLAWSDPSVSPYAYCSLDPLNRIDPDGRDDYELLMNGKWVKTETEDPYDRLFAQTGHSLIVKDKSIMGNMRERDYKNRIKYDDLVMEEMSKLHYTISNSNNPEMLRVFKFMADNTNVEWLLYEGQNGKALLGTQHLNGIVDEGAVNFWTIREQEVILELDPVYKIHSHTVGYMSEEDSMSADIVEMKKTPKINSYVYFVESGNVYKLSTTSATFNRQWTNRLKRVE